MTAQTFPPRTLNARKLARLADEPAPVIAAARPGHCACGLRLSVANMSGVCDACMDEKARLRKNGRLPGMCRCGRGPITWRSYCAACNREQAARAKAKHREMKW